MAVTLSAHVLTASHRPDRKLPSAFPRVRGVWGPPRPPLSRSSLALPSLASPWVRCRLQPGPAGVRSGPRLLGPHGPGRAPPGISATPGPASSVPRCSLQREHSELARVTATKVFCVPRARGLSLHSRGVCHGRDVTGASPRRAPCPVRYTGPSRCPLHPRHAPCVCACSGPCVHACACVGV